MSRSARTGKILASASGAGTVRLWDFIVVPVPIDDLPPGTKPRRSWDGIRMRRERTLGGDKRSLTKRIRGIAGDKSGISSMVFGSDGKTLTTASLSGQVRLWDTEKAKRMTTLVGHEDRDTDEIYSGCAESR